VTVRVVDLTQEVEIGHHDGHGAPEPLGAPELLSQLGRKVAGVEEPGLGVDARFLLEGRHVQRAVDEDERRDRRKDQPAVCSPERGERDSEGREDQVGRQALRGEELALRDRRPLCEMHHRGEKQVVRRHEDEAGDRPGESPASSGRELGRRSEDEVPIVV